MKILQVIDQLGLGGAERVCVNMANLLSRHKHNVKLVVFDKSGPLFDLIDKDVEVVVLGRKKNRFKAYKKLIQEVKEADIVHIHMRQNFKYVKKTLLAYRVKKKLILHDHFGEIAVNKRIPTFYKSFYKPDVYIGCSELLTDWAVNIVGLDSRYVFLVHNFVLKYNAQIPSNYEKKDLVLVGNMKPVKNHLFAVKLAKELGKNLTIYCTKTENNYFKSLNKKIESLGMKDRVFFKHNSINVQEELYQYNHALLTSTSEGDPLALIEYLSQGIPFLSYNIGESVKIIKNYFPFFVQDTFEMQEWLDNYKKMKEVPKKELEAIYEKHYSSEIFLEKYIDIYKKIM